MGYKKYDENELWQEFLMNDEKNVYTWANQKFGKKVVNNSGTLKAMFKGWTKRKEEVMKKRSEEVEKTLTKVNKELEDKLIPGKKKVVNLILAYLEGVSAKILPLLQSKDLNKVAEISKELELHKLKDVWEIIKVELGEPTRVSKNENINQNKALDEFMKLLKEIDEIKNAE